MLNFLIYKVKIQHSLLGAGLERYSCHLCRFFQLYMWIFTMLPPYYFLFNVDIYNRELWYLTSLSPIFKLYRGGQFFFYGEYPGKTINLPEVTEKLYHIMLYRVHLAWVGFELPALVVIGSDCIASYRKKYPPNIRSQPRHCFF